MLAVALMANRGVTVPPPPVTFIVACVDSGAARTFLPISIAHQLAIQPTELTPDVGGGGGVGSTFPTWSSTVPLLGKVLAFLSGGPPQPWGPDITLNPAFSDLDPEPAPLLGRADFFQAFKITFSEDSTAPSFLIQER